MANDFSYSSELAYISLAIFFFLTIKYANAYKRTTLKKQTHKNFFQLIFLLALYSVFSFAEADTYHYMELYENLYKADYAWHVEPIQFWIIKHIPHGYFLWRTIIWGLAAILYINAFNHLNITSTIIGIVITSCILVAFPQTRGTIGFAIMMLAIAYYKPLKLGNLWSFLASLCAIYFATFFHKSLSVYALFYILAVILPYNKKTIVLSLVAFPFLYYSVYALSSDVLHLDFLGEQTIDRGTSYLERGSEGVYNFLGVLTNSILWVAIVIYFYCSTDFYTNTVKNIAALNIQKYAYIMVYISFLFYGQNLSGFLYTRTLNFAMFPLSIALAYYLQNGLKTKLQWLSIGFFWLNTLYYISYHIYKFNG